MANWNTLKTAVASIINTNGNQAITGQLLQNVLNNIITTVGENATFAGIASITTNPGAPDGPVFYLATTAGTYVNFSGIEVSEGEAVILHWNNSTWAKKVTGFATQQNFLKLRSSSNIVTFENGGLVDGANSASNIRVRTTNYINQPTKITTKSGYKIFNLYKYDLNGKYISFEQISDSSIEIVDTSKYVYKITITDTSERAPISIENDDFLESIESLGDVNLRIDKDVILIEQGGMDNGANAPALQRLRTANIITRPFYIQLKEGYKVYFLQVYDVNGNFIEAKQVDLNYLCIAKTDGRGYRFTITKTDHSLPISLSDDYLEDMGFYENDGFLEIGKLYDGLNDLNSATVSKARTVNFLQAPFYCKVADDYMIDYTYYYDKEGNYIKYVDNRTSEEESSASSEIRITDTSYLYKFVVRRRDLTEIKSTAGIVEKFTQSTTVEILFNERGYYSEALKRWKTSSMTKATRINVSNLKTLDILLTARILYYAEDLGIIAAVYDKDDNHIRTLLQWGEFYGYNLKYTKESDDEYYIRISSNTELSDDPFPNYSVSYSSNENDLVTRKYLNSYVVKPISTSTVDVKDYGAKGDGVTDDTTALEEAFAESYKTKKALFFPPGIYMISRSLTLRNDMEIYGKNATIKKYAAATTKIVLDMAVGQDYAVVESTEGFVEGRQMFISWKTTKEEDGARRCTVGVITLVDHTNNRIYFKSSYSGIKEGAIVAHKAGCYLSTSYAILRSWGMLYECQRCYVHDITLDGNVQDDEDSDWMNGVIHIDADTGTVEGIPYKYKAKDNTFINVTIKNSPFDGISDQSSGGALVHNCIIDNCVMHGVHFGTGYNNAKVTGNSISNCGKAGVFWCQDVGNIIVEQNYIKDCGKGCSDLEYGTAAKNSIVSGNIFDGIKDIVIDFSHTAPTTGNTYGNVIISSNMVHNIIGVFVKALNRNKVNISNNMITSKGSEVSGPIIDIRQSNAIIIGNVFPEFENYVNGEAKEYANSWN